MKKLRDGDRDQSFQEFRLASLPRTHHKFVRPKVINLSPQKPEEKSASNSMPRDDLAHDHGGKNTLDIEIHRAKKQVCQLVH